jgi:hypothetical protein
MVASRLAAAHAGTLIVGHAPRVLDAALRSRKLGDGLARAPLAWRAFRRGRFDVAHAFSPEDALATAGWHGPLVLTVVDAPRRETAAARRLRLQATVWALERADAVVAADRTVAAGLQRWFAVESHVLHDASAYPELYAELWRGRTVGLPGGGGAH